MNISIDAYKILRVALDLPEIPSLGYDLLTMGPPWEYDFIMAKGKNLIGTHLAETSVNVHKYSNSYFEVG